jgi:hypothetical protein
MGTESNRPGIHDTVRQSCAEWLLERLWAGG